MITHLHTHLRTDAQAYQILRPLAGLITLMLQALWQCCQLSGIACSYWAVLLYNIADSASSFQIVPIVPIPKHFKSVVSLQLQPHGLFVK